MSRKLLTGNAAAAWGARLAGIDYVPAFPITPQTEIIETLSGWFDNGDIQGRLTVLESEHSMITAAGAAAASGVRVFTATSSQGLLHGMEMIYAVTGWRAPFVLGQRRLRQYRSAVFRRYAPCSPYGNQQRPDGVSRL